MTTRTLRYWEEIGLIKPTHHLCSGERRYLPTELERVAHVRDLQELLGLTLAEIASCSSPKTPSSARSVVKSDQFTLDVDRGSTL